MTTEATPRTVVTRYIEAVATGDLPTIRSSFSEDATWTYPGTDLPLSGTWRGRDTILNDFLGKATASLFTPGTTPTITLTNVLADGPTVIAEWRAQAEAATGARYDNHCLGIFTVHAGKITKVREYTDTRHAAQALFGL